MNRSAGRRGIDRVVENVADGLSQHDWIRSHDNRPLEIGRHILPLVFSKNMKLRDRLIDECGEIDALRRERRLPGIDAREDQQRVHQPAQMVDFLEHAADDLA